MEVVRTCPRKFNSSTAAIASQSSSSYVRKFNVIVTSNPQGGHFLCGQIFDVRIRQYGRSVAYYISDGITEEKSREYKGNMSTHVVVIGEPENYGIPKYGQWELFRSQFHVCKQGKW